MKRLTCLDLFSGAGGLSEGFLETGKYEFLGHVEWGHSKRFWTKSSFGYNFFIGNREK